jgi:hypothetical protein
MPAERRIQTSHLKYACPKAIEASANGFLSRVAHARKKRGVDRLLAILDLSSTGYTIKQTQQLMGCTYTKLLKLITAAGSVVKEEPRQVGTIQDGKHVTVERIYLRHV